MSGAQPYRLYGLVCQRCGSPLELPPDPQLLHIDCPQCGQDNLLPQHLVQARQQQFRAQMAYGQHARELHAQVEIAKSKSHVRLVLVLVLVLLVLVSCGGLAALGFYESRQKQLVQRRLTDPSLNGQPLMVARLEAMKATGCTRILVQPESHLGQPAKEATISLNMVPNDHCVHVLALTGTNAPISVRHTSDDALSKALPAASPAIDYRLCAGKRASHSFFFNSTEGQPYTMAALECPRTPSEGGSRTTSEDSKTNGKLRAQELLSWMNNSGCTNVIAPPEVRRGQQSFTLTLRRRAGCYNMFVASTFADVRFEVEFVDPKGKLLPVPRPAHEIRISHCAELDGEYSLELTPSTNDHYASVTVDCPRNGPEGLKRVQKMIRTGN